MSYRLQKAAVLGSGVMGAGIACHLANIGMDVLMLDIVPFDISEADKNKTAVRNSIVDGALKKALKSKDFFLRPHGNQGMFETLRSFSSSCTNYTNYCSNPASLLLLDTTSCCRL